MCCRSEHKYITFCTISAFCNVYEENYCDLARFHNSLMDGETQQNFLVWSSFGLFYFFIYYVNL